MTMTSNTLTDGQLLFRLQEFYGAEQDASAMGDHEFAQECADIVSVIRELQERRKADSAPSSSVAPEDLRRSFGAVARLNNEMYRWTSCMSYNGSYVGEPEGLLKRNIREIEHILDNCKNDKGE